MSGNDTLARLAAVIESRRGGDPDKSYVARLFSKGTDTILKKVGEEATETVMAGKGMQAINVVVPLETPEQMLKYYEQDYAANGKLITEKKITLDG